MGAWPQVERGSWSAGILPFSRAARCYPRDSHRSCPRELPEVLVLPMGLSWDPSFAPVIPLRFWSFPWDPSSVTRTPTGSLSCPWDLQEKAGTYMEPQSCSRDTLKVLALSQGLTWDPSPAPGDLGSWDLHGTPNLSTGLSAGPHPAPKDLKDLTSVLKNRRPWSWLLDFLRNPVLPQGPPLGLKFFLCESLGTLIFPWGPTQGAGPATGTIRDPPDPTYEILDLLRGPSEGPSPASKDLKGPLSSPQDPSETMFLPQVPLIPVLSQQPSQDPMDSLRTSLRLQKSSWDPTRAACSYTTSG